MSRLSGSFGQGSAVLRTKGAFVYGAAVILRDQDGIRWELAADFAPRLDRLFAGPAETVRSTAVRLITRHRLDGRVYYVKRYLHGSGVLIPAKYFFKSPASRMEWRVAPELIARGAEVVPHLAHGERWSWRGLVESILITEGREGFADVRTFRDVDPLKMQRTLGEFVRRIHQAGVLHRDLHVGNLLYSPLANAFCLVDVANVVLRPALSLEECVGNLVKLNLRLSLIPAFYEGYASSEAGLKAEVDRRTEARFRSSLPRNASKCLLHGPGFAPRRMGDLKWQVRVERLGEGLAWILEDPDGFLAHGARLLKDGRSSTVGCRDGLVLKRSNPRKRRNFMLDLFRDSRARRAFRLARHLELVQIASPRPVATADRRRFGFPWCSYLVMDEIPGATSLQAWGGNKRKAIRRVALMLARLHEEGFDHRDLKASNVVWDAQGQPCLLDLDGLRYVKRVPDRRAAGNLVRLAKAVLPVPHRGGAVAGAGQPTRTDCLRFLREYCRARGCANWRWWWREIARRMGSGGIGGRDANGEPV